MGARASSLGFKALASGLGPTSPRVKKPDTRKRGTAQSGEIPGQRKGTGFMRSWIQAIARFVQKEDGPTAVEYAVMLALIVVVCLAAITAMGKIGRASCRERGA